MIREWENCLAWICHGVRKYDAGVGRLNQANGKGCNGMDVVSRQSRVLHKILYNTYT